MNRKIHILTVVALLLIMMPTSVDARHTSAYGRVDTSDLADDPVDDLPIPVLFGVNLDDIVPDFGDPRGDGTRLHEGQDIRAPKGTPIVSPTEAVVISTGSGASAGKYVYTANPGGEVFRYMHLDEIANLSRGDELAVGDFIGTVGDTGNAPDGIYHLHWEIRDEDNDATDPFPRITKEFTLKQKMSFLSDIIKDFSRSERKKYAAFLVNTFGGEFSEATRKGYDVPSEIEAVLKDSDIGNRAKLLTQLQALINQIPSVLTSELKLGDDGARVVLLQFYLMYTDGGSAQQKLVAAGPTGYYGAITEAAVREYQERNNLKETGVYDSATRKEMIKAGE